MTSGQSAGRPASAAGPEPLVDEHGVLMLHGVAVDKLTNDC